MAPSSPPRTPSPIRPVRVFAVVMVLVFLVEMGIMLTLPMWNPWSLGDTALALVDSLVLTAVLAPAIWIVVVRPLRDLFEQRGRLLARVIDVQEHERARISRDLHDDLGQLLTAVSVGLRTLNDAPDLAQARERAKHLSLIVTDSLDVVRRIARGLRTGVLQDLGLRLAVERLVEDASQSSGIDMTASISFPEDRRFSPASEMTAYRLVQEALTNVVRHADAARADVRLDADDHTLTIDIRDDGRGFSLRDADARQSLGLQGMRERVALLGGSIRFNTAPGRGTAILIQLPVARPNADRPDPDPSALPDEGTTAS